MVARVCFPLQLALPPPATLLAAAATGVVTGKVKGKASVTLRDLILGEQRIKHKTRRVDPPASFYSSNPRKNISTANANGCRFANVMEVFRDYQ